MNGREYFKSIILISIVLSDVVIRQEFGCLSESFFLKRILYEASLRSHITLKILPNRRFSSYACDSDLLYKMKTNEKVSAYCAGLIFDKTKT